MTELPPLADAEILAARGPRHPVDATRPYAWFVEAEPMPNGTLEDVATIFTSNSECSFRCLMCDLWKYTTPRGTLPAPVADQVEWALAELANVHGGRHAPHVKIYNAGSFFDTGSISLDDRARIAKAVAGRRTLVVECHPRLVDRHCSEFAAAIAPVELQLAMGLETVDPVVLPRLNKGMSLSDFESAARSLTDWGLRVRAFIVLGLPGQLGERAVYWAKRSIDYAFSVGVECCVVIPARPGNGIVDQLERTGHFARPTLPELEATLAYGLESRRGRVLADVWDIEDFFDCAECSASRAASLRRMNATQRPAPALECTCQTQPMRAG
jgi:radical SAM enzyme (TIGR01210 family)